MVKFKKAMQASSLAKVVQRSKQLFHPPSHKIVQPAILPPDMNHRLYNSTKKQSAPLGMTMFEKTMRHHAKLSAIRRGIPFVKEKYVPKFNK
jgi:hypothetical protein